MNLKLVNRVFDDVVLYFMSLKYFFFKLLGIFKFWVVRSKVYSVSENR